LLSRFLACPPLFLPGPGAANFFPPLPFPDSTISPPPPSIEVATGGIAAFSPSSHLEFIPACRSYSTSIPPMGNPGVLYPRLLPSLPSLPLSNQCLTPGVFFPDRFPLFPQVPAGAGPGFFLCVSSCRHVNPPALRAILMPSRRCSSLPLSSDQRFDFPHVSTPSRPAHAALFSPWPHEVDSLHDGVNTPSKVRRGAGRVASFLDLLTIFGILVPHSWSPLHASSDFTSYVANSSAVSLTWTWFFFSAFFLPS